VIELSAIQAAVRSLAISAMKGSRLSQKALAELVRDAEDRKTKTHLSLLENAFEYKQKWTAEIERRARLGIDDPDPIPHPDDVHICMRTGKVSTEGPMDEREKKMHDALLERRAEAQKQVNDFAERYRKARSPDSKAMWLEEWHFEQHVFDIINDRMQGRYKTRLENRSFATGASQEGKALQEVIRNW
jgi:hypothetical protein